MPQHSIHNVSLAKVLPSEPGTIMVGNLERIDLVQREITISVGTHLFEVEVPPQCAVLLRGERIKLRIMQPGDVVRIGCVTRGARIVAECVEVAPVNTLPTLDKS